jgi:hypothetical protein
MTKLSHFKIRLYATKPHIVCLCETWLKQNREPSFINYRSFFCNRKDRVGGGLAFLVRADMSTVDKNIIYYGGGKLEVQAITLINNNKKNTKQDKNPIARW